MLGKFVKLVESGEILELKSFDPVSQTVEIVLPTGAVSSVGRHEIERITTDEQMEMERSLGELPTKDDAACQLKVADLPI